MYDYTYKLFTQTGHVVSFLMLAQAPRFPCTNRMDSACRLSACILLPLAQPPFKTGSHDLAVKVLVIRLFWASSEVKKLSTCVSRGHCLRIQVRNLTFQVVCELQLVSRSGIISISWKPATIIYRFQAPPSIIALLPRLDHLIYLSPPCALSCLQIVVTNAARMVTWPKTVKKIGHPGETRNARSARRRMAPIRSMILLSVNMLLDGKICVLNVGTWAMRRSAQSTGN